MPQERRITIPYKPRAIFEAYHNRHQRFAIGVAHRRAGKTVATLNDVIKRAITTSLENYRASFIMPYRGQAKDTAWEYLKRYSRPLWGPHKPNESELYVRLGNDARIKILGADNEDSLRGGYLDDVVLDEYADMSPTVFPQIIRPMLADRKGTATFIGTPKGRNAFFKLFQTAQAESETWFWFMLKASETGILPEDELAAARRDMTPEQFEQEFECFKPDARVMCANAARPIAEIVAGDSVLTHTGRFRRVKSASKRQYAGQLVRIEAYGNRPLVCTPEHPIWVCDPASQSYQWKAAKDILRGDWLASPKMDIRARGIISEALAKIITWYTCEGNVSGNRLTFSIGAHEPDYVSDLCAALESCEQKFDLRTAAGVTSVGVNSVILADFLVGQCGSLARNKRLPLSLLRGHEQIVWDTLFKGDGCVHVPQGRGHARTVYAYSTVSEGLAQQVQIIGSSLGFSGSYSVRENQVHMLAGGRRIEGGRSFQLQMRAPSNFDARGSDTRTKSAKNATLGRVFRTGNEDYVGPVYNLSIADDESYVVNGRAVHNCSFSAAIVGAYYGREMAAAQEEGRIRIGLPRLPGPIHTAWDFGNGLNMAVWAFQVGERGPLIHDFIQMSGCYFEDYLKEVSKRGYDGFDYVPHDAKVPSFETGRTRIETMFAFKRKPVLVADHHVEDGINAVKLMLPRCQFNAETCEPGIEALRQHRQEWDDKARVFKKTPLHDWSSHASDAARYLAMAWREMKTVEPPPEPKLFKPTRELTIDEWMKFSQREGKRERV